MAVLRCCDEQIRKYVKKLQQVEALFNEVGTGGVDITRAMEKAISTAEEMVKTVESDADTLIGKILAFFFVYILGVQKNPTNPRTL